jgi:hypothetical protein
LNRALRRRAPVLGAGISVFFAAISKQGADGARNPANDSSRNYQRKS